MDFQHIQDQPAVHTALRELADYQPTLATALAIQAIPAPTFDEGLRSQEVVHRFHSLGLADVTVDAMGNVYGRRPGRSAGPGLLVSAHLDTVFPRETDLAVRYIGERIYGPGLGDNSLGVAALLHLAQAFQQFDLPNERDIWFVADVGEEGLGDLRGMRAVVDRLAPLIGSVVVLEGCDFGALHHQAIGVRRYRISAIGAGGHSWGDFGTPSAIHALVRLAARLTDISVPQRPRTTFNIGTIEGGTSVNTIARHAAMLLDMRSADPSTLDSLVAQVDAIISQYTVEQPAIQLSVEVVGDRPPGAISRTHPLVQLAQSAYRSVGAVVLHQQSSTDANIPLSRGIPAVCIGLTDGGNAHRLDEYIEPANLGRGMQALLLLAFAAASPAS